MPMARFGGKFREESIAFCRVFPYIEPALVCIIALFLGRIWRILPFTKMSLDKIVPPSIMRAHNLPCLGLESVDSFNCRGGFFLPDEIH